MPQEIVINTKSQLSKVNDSFELITVYDQLPLPPSPPIPPGPRRCLPANILPDGGFYFGRVLITLETSEIDGVVFYTLDGTNPTPSSFLYTGPFYITQENVVVKTRVFSETATPSVIFTQEYEIDPYRAIIEPESGEFNGSVTVTMFPNFILPGLEIRYTLDGSEPDETSFLYTSPIVVNRNRIVKAVVGIPGFYGPISQATYTIKALSPILNTITGTYITNRNVVATNPNEIGTVQYRINGGSWVSNTSINITETSTVDWRIIDDNLITSDIISVVITIKCAAPTISPVGSSFSVSQLITVTTNEPGGVSRYTTNGSEPNELSTLYTAPFSITDDTTVKVKTFRLNTLESNTSQEVFILIRPLFVVGDNNPTSGSRLFSSSNNGTSWSQLQPFGNVDYNFFRFAISENSQIMMVAGSPSGTSALDIRISTNTGLSWFEPALGGTPTTCLATRMSLDGQKMLILANRGSGVQLFYSGNAGTSWANITPAGVTTLNECQISPDGNVIYCARTTTTSSVPVIYRSTDNGANWTALITTTQFSMFGPACSNGYLYFTDSLGSTHHRLKHDETTLFDMPLGFSTATSWAVTADDSILIGNLQTGGNQHMRRSTNQGASFSVISVPSSATGLSVAMNSTGTRIIASTFTNPLYRSLNGGLNYSRMPIQPASSNYQWFCIATN